MSLLSHFSLSLPAFITDTNKNFLSQTLFLPGQFTLSLSPSIATEQAQTFHPSLSLSLSLSLLHVHNSPMLLQKQTLSITLTFLFYTNFRQSHKYNLSLSFCLTFM